MTMGVTSAMRRTGLETLSARRAGKLSARNITLAALALKLMKDEGRVRQEPASAFDGATESEASAPRRQRVLMLYGRSIEGRSLQGGRNLSDDFDNLDETPDERALLSERPKGDKPVLQEKRKGHNLLKVGPDTYVEVSKFRGKIYAQIRVWFEADDGIWYRTKKGINLEASLFKKLFASLDVKAICAFVEAEELDPYEDSGS